MKRHLLKAGLSLTVAIALSVAAKKLARCFDDVIDRAVDDLVGWERNRNG